MTAVGDDPVAAQIDALRAIGGDVRISFGGEDGSELAQTCTSVSQLEAAYQQVISAYDVNKIDFDIEGAAVDDTAANALRDQALVAFAQSKHLAWLSMWSAGRDQECPGGAADFAAPTCSSIVQTPDAFMDAFGAY